MHTKWMKAFGALVLVTLIPAAARAQTDIAGNFYNTLTTKSVTGNGITQTSTNSVGGMLELRHIKTPWIGYEFTYSLNPDNQTVTPVKGSCGYFCGNPTESLSVNNNSFSLDWVISRRYGHLRPFVVGGFGFTIAVSSGINGTYLNTPVKPTYIAGGGTDWDLGSRLGIRLQYRENIFTAPHFDPAYPNTGRFTPEGQPMIGVYYRFNRL